ncbi:pseudouridylate synthase [[Emmonsia] crescens]|uniref:Pseudouridylate synthase n=1 Tax=[Emmonsia] crescens TaxID=73230 RepID=A0A0G2J6F3_9EURO|nr:pseudouridylate synthase [Emmonsia crescens UAMH 3008]
MALTTVDRSFPVEEKEVHNPPPDVVVTPCDPLPRPYYLEGGLRRVAPYHYTYSTYCKERWRGRGLLDVFGTEFRDRPREYYQKAIEDGAVCINGKAVSTDTKIQNGDVISHTLHRHEPPVTSQPIGIIHEDDDMIVIDKPAGVPVHPAGRYNYNSILEIMKAERGNGWVPYPCNRLDRLTSGVMFIGKHPKGAEQIGEKLRSRTVRKEYVARVKGKFPDGVVLCDQPMLKISPILGLNRARASGKEARTKFRRIAYYPPHKPAEKSSDSSTRPATPPATLPDQMNISDSPIDTPTGAAAPIPMSSDEEGYSIVHCLPLTGRTHQLRVHLQYLGHPITNDPIYSNRRVFGHSLGKADATGENDQQIIYRLSKMGKSEPADSLSYQTFQTPPPESVSKNDPAVVDKLLAKEHEVMVNDYLKRKGEKMNGKKCETCGTELYTDPGVHELGIFLHAVSYADVTGAWKYKSKMPGWALPPEGMEGPTTAPDWVDDEEEEIIGKGQHGDSALVEGLGAVNLNDLIEKNMKEPQVKENRSADGPEKSAAAP